MLEKYTYVSPVFLCPFCKRASSLLCNGGKFLSIAMCGTRFSVLSLKEMKAFDLSHSDAFQDEEALETLAAKWYRHCSVISGLEQCC